MALSSVCPLTEGRAYGIKTDGDRQTARMARLLSAAHPPAEFRPTLFALDPRPDFLIGVGQMDDLAVILGGLKLFLRLCPPEIVQEHLKAISAGRER